MTAWGAAALLAFTFGCQAPGEDGAGGGERTKRVNPAAVRRNVDVVLREMEIVMPRELPAGPTTFKVRNAGTMLHGFEIEGQGIERELEKPLQPNDQGTLQVDLLPGQYRVWCPLDGHAGRGMELRLTVAQPQPQR